jgi:hypothetical protein
MKGGFNASAPMRPVVLLAVLYCTAMIWGTGIGV